MKIEFDEDWELSVNNPIYNLIISDKFTGRKYLNIDYFNYILSDKLKYEKLELPNFSLIKDKYNNNKRLSINNEIQNQKEEDITKRRRY